MPHSGLMNATKITEADTALMRSRRELLGGKRRLQDGLAASGMSALYDAVLFGMHYYIAMHEHCASWVKPSEFWNATSLFQLLVRAGVFEDPLSFNRFTLAVERSVWHGSFPTDAEFLVTEVETMLTKLGVMPRNEKILEGG